MKIFKPATFFLFVALFFSSCIKDECDAIRTYVRYDPVYLQPTELRQPIEMTEARALENTGKIYYYKDFLLINELNEGIHFFDNSNPESPQAVSFLPIPGNVDMAIRNDILYADNYVDLLSFDISDVRNPILESRLEEVFHLYGFNRTEGYIIDYKPTDITETLPCNSNWGIWNRVDDFIFLESNASFDAIRGSAANASTPGGSVVGTGGSLARFTIAKDFLYTVSEYDLKIFDLELPEMPSFLNTLSLGWGIETIFPYQDNLFIGARNGMHIVSIESPARPEYQGTFWHTNACDPVYVDGDVAYVTLRDGTECETFTNQLDVVNIKDLRNPFLVDSWDMHHPIGLSVYEERLYLCEDDEGLKVFDASVPEEVGNKQVNQIKGFTAIDIITLSKEEIALVIGPEGLYQYDITDPDNPSLLSIIAVEN